MNFFLEIIRDEEKSKHLVSQAFIRFQTSQGAFQEKFMNHATFFGSSRPEVFCEKIVLKNFAKFTGKHLYQNLFFIKKRLWYRCFPVNFAKFLRIPFLIEHLWWLLLFFAENDAFLSKSHVIF